MSAEFLIRSSVTVGAVLGGAGASIVVIETIRRRPFLDSQLARKWATWCGLSLMWLIALSSTIALSAILATVGAVIGSEYSRLTRLGTVDRIVTMVLPVVGLIGMAFGSIEYVVIAVIAAVTLPPLLAGDISRGPGRVGALLGGSLFATLPVIALWVLATKRPDLFITLLFAVALSDVVAFVVGSTIGRRPLAPALSPNKTKAGVVGNLAGALLGVAIGSWVSPLDFGVAAILAITTAVGSVWGDLLESLFKRGAGVKDAGHLLPGFGGLLDRLDSMVICAPLTWLVFSASGVL